MLYLAVTIVKVVMLSDQQRIPLNIISVQTEMII